MTPLLERRWLRRGFLIGVAALLVLSTLQPAWGVSAPAGRGGTHVMGGVPLSFLPKDNKNTFLVSLHLPEATPLEVTDWAAREVGRRLRGNPYVLSYQTFVGMPAVVDFNGLLRGASARTGPQFADIRVNLVDKAKRGATSIAIVRDLRPAIAAIAARYPGAVLQLVEDPPGPPVRATVLAELYGPDAERLRALAARVQADFRRTYGMAEVFTSVPAPLPEYRIQVDREKAARSGVSAAQVAQTLAALISGDTLGYVHAPGERAPVPVRIEVPRAERIEPEDLAWAWIANVRGERIPLSELVSYEQHAQRLPIQHKNGERVEYVGGELGTSAPVYAVLDLDRRLDGLPLDEEQRLRTANLRLAPVRPSALEGYQLLWEGELRLTLDAFRDMGLALGLAVVLIYLMLVGYYRSFRLPLAVMVPIPLALVGVFPGHWLLGETFSAASMVGVIALAGVVVRNSLLLIDFARDYQRQGYALDDAVREAGAVRLRPILLTTLAIVLGTLVMVPDPVVGGIAISLIFGSVSSALLTLFTVPLLYRRIARRLPGTGM